MVEKVYECNIGLFAFCYGKVDIFHVWFISLYMLKSSYIYNDDYKPPYYIQCKERGNAYGHYIWVWVRKNQKIYIDAFYYNYKYYSPRNQNRIYPMFFYYHKEASPVFLKFFQEFRVSCYIERFEHPGDNPTEVDEHIIGE